jgi:uncharacterized protein (TIGR03435 family)
MQKTTPAQQREQVDLMEQSLLADRFKLKVNFDTREMPVYALVIAKGGTKLTPSKDGESSKLFSLPDNHQQNEMTANAVTLDQFAHSPLWGGGGRLVVDQTGLKGTYDFTLKWRSEQLKQQLDATTRQLDVTSERLQLFELRVQLLEEKLRLQRIAKYGPGSEKLTSQQLELLEFEPGSAIWRSRPRANAMHCWQCRTRRSASGTLAARRCLRIFRASCG